MIQSRLLTGTFTTAAFGRSSFRPFEASPHKAAPKDLPPSFVQHYASRCVLDTSRSSNRTCPFRASGFPTGFIVDSRTRGSQVATLPPSGPPLLTADYLPGMLCSLPRWSHPYRWLSGAFQRRVLPDGRGPPRFTPLGHTLKSALQNEFAGAHDLAVVGPDIEFATNHVDMRGTPPGGARVRAIGVAERDVYARDFFVLQNIADHVAHSDVRANGEFADAVAVLVGMGIAPEFVFERAVGAVRLGEPVAFDADGKRMACRSPYLAHR